MNLRVKNYNIIICFLQPSISTVFRNRLKDIFDFVERRTSEIPDTHLHEKRQAKFLIFTVGRDTIRTC